MSHIDGSDEKSKGDEEENRTEEGKDKISQSIRNWTNMTFEILMVFIFPVFLCLFHQSENDEKEEKKFSLLFFWSFIFRHFQLWETFNFFSFSNKTCCRTKTVRYIRWRLIPCVWGSLWLSIARWCLVWMKIDLLTWGFLTIRLRSFDCRILFNLKFTRTIFFKASLWI